MAPKCFLVVSTQNDSGLGRFYANALSTLGSRVSMHGIQAVSYYPGFRDKVFFKIKNSRPLSRFWRMVEGKNLLTAAKAFAPDYIIVFRCEFLSAEIVAELSKIANGRVVNIYPDSPLVIPGLRPLGWTAALEHYETIFTFSRGLIPVFCQLGAKRAKWLPFAYSPDTHRPRRSNDLCQGISYFGSWGPLQEQWLEQLIPHDLKIYGSGWHHLRSDSRLHGCWVKGQGIGQNMAEAISNSLMTFNLVRAEHGCAHSMKTFEIPACGGFMLSNWTEEQAQFFKDSEECVFFHSKDELTDKVGFYRSHHSARDEIRNAGMCAVRHHTYESRARALLSYFKTGDLVI